MIKRILVPLDGSELAEEALNVAGELAQGLSGEVILLRVVPPPVPGRFYAPHMPDELQEAQVREAEAYMEEARHKLAQGIKIDAHVLSGEVAATLIEFAASKDYDLIVMSSHGLGGRGWQVFGSVAQKVLHGASRPILIVRPGAAGWEREEEQEESRDDEALLDEMALANAESSAVHGMKGAIHGQ